MKTFIAFSMVILGLIGCQKNPNLVAPAKKVTPPRALGQESLGSGDAVSINYNPKVDVLFVVDDSDSMDAHQKLLATNIGQFVEGFEKNQAIDYHVGVVSIFDSKRFGAGPEHQVHKYYPLGKLRPLKNKVHPTQDEGALPYVTRATPDFENVLKGTIYLGNDPYKLHGPNHDEGGPEKEEMYSPIIASLGGSSWIDRFPAVKGSYQAGVAQFNKGFYRPDAHLVIVIITDGNDLTPDVTADDMVNLLNGLKPDGGPTVTLIGVLSPQDEPNCAHDGDGNPVKIEETINKMKAQGTINQGKADGKEISLCSPNFGKDLAQIGSDIQKKIAQAVIPIDSIPDQSHPIIVKYGDQVIPADNDKGWSWDADRNAIIINPNVELSAEPNAKLSINFTPMNMENILTGHARGLGN